MDSDLFDCTSKVGIQHARETPHSLSGRIALTTTNPLQLGSENSQGSRERNCAFGKGASPTVTTSPLSTKSANGSRYRLCKETGVDPGHLSRVFASRSELSLQSLQRILEALHAALIIQPEENLAERVSPKRAADALAAAAR